MRRINDNRIDSSRRIEGAHNHFMKMSSTTKLLIFAVLIVFIVCDTGVGAGIINSISLIIGYYMIAMIVLTVMMYFHHADNKVGQFLFTLMAPVFAFVSHFNPIKDQTWSTPLFSVILVALVQNLIQNL